MRDGETWDPRDDCASDDECDTVQNYLCVVKSGKGTCQIPTVVANGTSCSAPGAACNLGFYCGVDEACVQSKAVGKSCDADFECATGLVCDTNKCTERVSAEKCTDDKDCTTNVCDIPSNSSEGRCVSSVTLAASTSICESLR